MEIDRTTIDFHNLAKPANLSNSAVLRMLEEEEARGRGQGIKRVAWPPPPEDAELVLQEQAPVYSQVRKRVIVGNTRLNGVKLKPAFFKEGLGAQQPTPVLAIRPTQSPVLPPPSTITLRQSAPTRQNPPPVFQSQPATASMKGGARNRGDQKWPPESVKQQAAAENEARVALAKGPAVRPRLVRKDYSNFFAQHALNSTYPGYKAPPGTQHYIEDGISNL